MPQFEIINHVEDQYPSKNKSILSKSLRLGLKKTTRNTYDRQTLNGLSEEQRYSEIAISEVKKLVCILYGTLIRFYLPVMKFQDLHEMREDIIELLTSITVKGEMSSLLLQLCRICTREEESMLMAKYTEFIKVKPEQIGIDSLFRCNEASKLIDLFKEQQIMQESENYKL